MRSASVPLTCGLLALLASATPAVAGGSDETTEQVLYDLTGVEYFGGPPELFTILEVTAGARLVEFRWENVVLETYDNVGVPNWGSEAVLGIEAIDNAGETFSEYFFPFPDANSGPGPFGPVDGSLDLLLVDMFADQSGHVSVLGGSTWEDGSGLPAGKYLSGILALVYAPIPAPAALALFGIAAMTSRRRRR